MHIVFQFPVIDLRSLVPDHNGRLDKPQWPNPPESKKMFIRGFGKVKSRNLGGSKEFIGESYFCDLKSAVKFNNPTYKAYQIAKEKPVAIVNSYRRYFHDGRFTGKIEIAFADNIEKVLFTNENTDKPISLQDILTHYSKMKLGILGEEVDLYKAGPRLAQLYQEKSTYKKQIQHINPLLVTPGEASIILTFSESQHFNLPKYHFLLKKIPTSRENKTIDLYGYKLKLDGYNIKVYIIKSPVEYHSQENEAKKIIRDLRMNLLRVHLEKEAIRIILQALNKKYIVPDEKSVNLINEYFKQISEKLFKKERYSIDQGDFLDYALQSEEKMSPKMLERLEGDIILGKWLISNIRKVIKKMEKKVILFVCTNPDNKNFTGFDKEYKDLKQNLTKAADHDNYDLEIETAVLKNEFACILEKYQPQYLHLSLHGTEEEGLYFEDQFRNYLPMPVSEFGAIIENYTRNYDLKLIILSACNSRNHAKAVKKLCDYAIGTITVFPVPAALLYSKEFYSKLFSILSDRDNKISECHRSAIKAIKDENFGELKVKNRVYPIHKIPVLIKK